MSLKQVHFFKLLLFAAAIFLNSFLYAQPGTKKGNNFQKERPGKSGILFIEDSWNAALKKAYVEHKYIFVDAYASWCGPCKLLKATTFKNKEATAFFNQYFINLSIDMEKGEGPALAAQWEIQGYPTLIIFDDTGKPVLGSVGFLKSKDLIKFGRQALQKEATQLDSGH